MRWVIVVCIFIVFPRLAQAQYLDLARVEYTYLPGANANLEMQAKRALFNFPFKLKEDIYFFAGIDYTKIDLLFKEEVDSYNKAETEDFHEIDINFTYTFKLNDNWRFGTQVTPSFFSNFVSGIQSNDFLVSGLIVFVNDQKADDEVKKPWRIIAGLAYASTSRLPIPVPFFSYYRKFHKKWSYNVGAPVTNLQYHLNEKHRLKLYAEGDGMNASLQNTVMVKGIDTANRLRTLIIMAGVRYEYKFSEHLESYINITRTINSSFQLRDDRERVFIPDIDNAMLYRMGLRFKI